MSNRLDPHPPPARAAGGAPERPAEAGRPEADRGGVAVVLVRRVLPAAILLAGLVLVLVPGTASLGAITIGIAALVVFANWLMRLGLSSQGDREREEQAREHFTRTGRWPSDS